MPRRSNKRPAERPKRYGLPEMHPALCAALESLAPEKGDLLVVTFINDGVGGFRIREICFPDKVAKKDE